MCKEELICDFAQEYRIYNIKDWPPDYIAILANGLDDNSRTKRKITGEKLPREIYLLAGIQDSLNVLLYAMTDPKKRGKAPESILGRFLDDEPKEKEQTFETPEDFRNTWKNIVGNKHGEKCNSN